MSKIIRYYRHSETEWNQEGRLQGWLDSPLTALGKKQAKEASWQPDIVFCSDLQRAVTTAQHMFPQHILYESPQIREIYLGQWQGQLIQQLQDDSHYICYQKMPQLFRAQSQESFETVTNRMVKFHEQLCELPYEKIAVVSHGVALACLFCALNNDSMDYLWQHMLTSTAYKAYSLKTL